MNSNSVWHQRCFVDDRIIDSTRHKRSNAMCKKYQIWIGHVELWYEPTW